MTSATGPVAAQATDVAPCRTPSHDPEPFASRMAGRTKRALGAVFGLANLGVNLTEPAPGAISALRHAHRARDESVHVLQGHPVPRTDAGENRLSPGMCAGFRADSGDAHQLTYLTDETAVHLEIGDRSPGDTVTCPDDDLLAVLQQGRWVVARRDGRPH